MGNSIIQMTVQTAAEAGSPLPGWCHSGWDAPRQLFIAERLAGPLSSGQILPGSKVLIVLRDQEIRHLRESTAQGSPETGGGTRHLLCGWKPRGTSPNTNCLPSPTAVVANTESSRAVKGLRAAGCGLRAASSAPREVDQISLPSADSGPLSTALVCFQLTAEVNSRCGFEIYSFWLIQFKCVSFRHVTEGDSVDYSRHLLLWERTEVM